MPPDGGHSTAGHFDGQAGANAYFPASNGDAIAGMMGMKWSYFTFINVISGFVWAGSHILPGMLLTHWLDSIGLSLELVIVVGALVLTAVFLLVHYWKRILLLFAPLMGNFGKSLQARLRSPEAPH